MKPWGCIVGLPLVVLALVFILFGILLIIGATNPATQNQALWLGVGFLLVVVGLLLLGIAGATMYGGYRSAQAEKKTEIIQRVELAGDMSTEQLKCKACGATLGKDSIEVKAGAAVISCPYCGTTYHLEEEPKW
jgi:DNA-directed RNA polymerase subunit RPC12/RpoP